MKDPIVVEVEGIGRCTMKGTGPWSVRNNNGTFDIIDSNRITCPPDVFGTLSGGRGSKTQQNLIFSKMTDSVKVVEAANAALNK